MNQHVGKSNFIKKFTAIALSLLFCQHTFAQSTENQQIVFEGSLTDASGNPIDLAGAELTFYVSANGCYLYGETSTVSGDSQGNIVHRIGGGSQVAGSPNSFTQNIFFGSVSGTTSFASSNCTALSTHTRLAEVYYGAQNISAAIKIGTVPYAHNATMLNGKSAADFIQVSNDTNTIFYSGSAGQFLSKSASGSLTWTNSSLTAGEISTALGYTPANSATIILKSNNLADLTSATIARANLGLGTLATRNSVNLATAEVTGVLPLANGGSPWLTHANGYYITSNTAIGTSAVLTNTKLSVEGNTPSQVAKFNNTATNGYGVRIDVAGSTSAQYALNINNASGTMFMVQNDGYIGIGTLSPTAGLNLVNDNGPTTKDDIQINTFGNNTPALALQKAKGSAGAPTPLLANENIGNLRWDGYTGSAYANLVAVSGYAETDLSTSLNSFLTISTNSNGTMAERVRVNSMGKVGIGTTNPTATLTVNGSIRSISGGYEYPDGSSQTTSAFGGYEHMIASCIDQMTCTVSCSAGKKILSGGCSLAAAINRLIGSFPNTLNSWHCAANNSDTITAYAICTKM